MRSPLSLAVVATTLAVAGAAQAQQPVDPYNGPVQVVPSAPEPPEVMNPYAAQPYYPPPVYQAAPPPPAYAPPYYVYPPQPLYLPPAVVYRPTLRCQSCVRATPRPYDTSRRFSLGVDGTVMG